MRVPQSLLDDMVKRRAGGVASLQVTWRTAVERLASTGLSAYYLDKFTLASASPNQLLALSDWLASDMDRERDADSVAAELLHEVEISEQDLKGWLEALDFFYQWLAGKGRTTPLHVALGYLHCCAEAQGASKSLLSLQATTEYMLGQYGFVGQAS